jgi:hypothetical protein
MWAFWYAKEKNVPREMKGKPGFGDVWTWTALDPAECTSCERRPTMGRPDAEHISTP